MKRKNLRLPSVVYNACDVIIVTLHIITERGNYVSQHQGSTSGEMPTSHWVLNYFKHKDVSKELKTQYQNKAEDIISYYQNVTNTDDEFILKAQELLILGSISNRMIGYIVALPSLYERQHERVAKLAKFASAYAGSKFIGELGKKGEFFIKIIDLENVSGIFNYRFSDQNNNFGYFSLNKKDPNFEKFDCIVVNAEPGVHESNKETGLKETGFNKVKFIENLGKGSEI